MSTDWVEQWLRDPDAAENGFDLDEFLAQLRTAVDEPLQLSVGEAPLRVFLAAQQGGHLRRLQISEDASGLPYLMGVLAIGDDLCMLISESFTGVGTLTDADEELLEDESLTSLLLGLDDTTDEEEDEQSE
jgi:hypothetical protein